MENVRMLTLREIGLLRESVWHANQRGDVSQEDRQELHDLYVLLDGRPLHIGFKNTTDELHFNLIRAEQHARQAHDLLFREDAPKRSFWFRILVGRAQNILISLYAQEMNRKEK